MVDFGLFAIKDEKASSFHNPFVCINRMVAIRMFVDAVQDANTDYHKHPADYTLYEVGSWNPEKGSPMPFETPDFVLSGGSALEKIN